VIDFAAFAGKNLTLAHTTIFADTDYVGSDKVMRFKVGKTVTDRSNNGPIPKKLVDIKFPTNPVVERTFNFVRNIGQPWTINGKPWSNPMSRVQMKPPLGTVEKYVLRGTGGWSHPVHLHLVDMQLLSRSIGNANQKPGRMYLEEYEKGALKDIALLGDNEQVTVLAKFVPYEGVYVSTRYIETVGRLTDHGRCSTATTWSMKMFRWYFPHRKSLGCCVLTHEMVPRWRHSTSQPCRTLVTEIELEVWKTRSMPDSKQSRILRQISNKSSRKCCPIMRRSTHTRIRHF
jgi:hypothetical protein